MLARLQQLSDDHFGVMPDEVHWGHVTSITDSVALLRRITDAWFSEGEHAGDDSTSARPLGPRTGCCRRGWGW